MSIVTTTTTRQGRHPAITAASILCFIMGLGWSIGSPSSIVYMIRHRALPWVRVILPVGGAAYNRLHDRQPLPYRNRLHQGPVGPL